MAGFTDQYPHLPGHLTEFKDGGMQLTKQANPPKTDSILLLGTAVDGPVMEPVKVDSETYEAVFGKCVDSQDIPNGATLAQGFEEAYNAGCRDIRLMRISGSAANYVLKGAATSKVEDAVFEALLGRAEGNKLANSTFYLQDVATEITEVQADGATLTVDQFDVELNAVVPGFLTTGTQIVAQTDATAIKLVDGTNTEVVLATKDIFEEIANPTNKVYDDDAAYVTDAKLFTLVLYAGVDYVVKGAVTATDAYLDHTTVTIVNGYSYVGEILHDLIRTKIAVHDDICDSGSYVVVKYKDAQGNYPVENASDISGTYKANGDVQEFGLITDIADPIVPMVGMTKVYFDGVEYTELDTVADSTTPVFKVVKFLTGSVQNAKLIIQPGKHAKKNARIDVRTLYKKTKTYIPEFKLETTFGGLVYNESQVQVDSNVLAGGLIEKVIKITKPKAKRSQPGEAPLTYSSLDYPNFSLLARAINSDSNNDGIFRAIVTKDMELTSTSLIDAIPVAKNFSDGEDGINLTKQEMFEKLSGTRDANGNLLVVGAYQLLENYTVDTVIPLGVYADDELVGKNDNFAYELALFCAIVSYRNHTTIGFLQTSSPEDGSLVKVEAKTKELENYKNLYYMKDTKGDVILDSEQKPIDLGRYICVLGGGDSIFNSVRLGVYAENSAAGLAGYVSTLPIYSAPTNKALKYAQGLKVKYSNSQLDRLTANRLITLKYKGDETTVAVVDAMTCAAPGSDYARLSSMRAVRAIANDIRDVADPFLGEPNTVQQRNALSALIDKKLGQHKDAGAIQDYNFNIIATAYDELVGQAKIELTLVPSQELRKITTIISLKPSL